MSAITGTGQVLTRLDDRPATVFHWRLSLLATLGGFLFGYDTSNIGSALDFAGMRLPPGPAVAQPRPVRQPQCTALPLRQEAYARRPRQLQSVD